MDAGNRPLWEWKTALPFHDRSHTPRYTHGYAQFPPPAYGFLLTVQRGGMNQGMTSDFRWAFVRD